MQVEPLNQRAIRHIAEADVLEVNRALGGEHGGVFLVRHAVILIQQGENARGAGEGVLQLGHNAGDFVEGLGVLAGVAEENAQVAHGDAAADRRQRADERDRRIDDVVDQTGGGVREAGEERRVQADAPQFIVDAVKIAQRGGFVPEGLHDFLPFNHLVDERRLLHAHTRLLGEVVVRLSGDEGRDEHRQRRQHHDQQGNHPVFDEHDGQRADNQHNAGEQLREAHEEAVGEGVHIGNHAADEVAGGMRVQIAQRQALELVERRVAQVTADVVGNLVVAGGKELLGNGGQRRNDGNPHRKDQHAGQIYLTRADHLVNRLAGQNRDEQLRRRAHARAQQADNHQHPIRLHVLQDAQERALLLLELVGLHCTSLPFRNWLSWISR